MTKFNSYTHSFQYSNRKLFLISEYFYNGELVFERIQKTTFRSLRTMHFLSNKGKSVLSLWEILGCELTKFVPGRTEIYCGRLGCTLYF